MLTIPLSNVPNQSFEFAYGEYVYSVTLKTFRDIVYASVVINDEPVCQSIRCVNRGWLIPYEAIYSGKGNFMFECDSEDYPNYESFGKSCYLRFYSYEEINVEA